MDNLELKLRYDRLVEKVKKMLAAQAEAKKRKTDRNKWIIANNYQREVEKIIQPPENKVSQAQLDWLGQ